MVALADGATLTVLDAAKTQRKVRLHGIDAPERKQAFGTKAREALAALVFQKDVTVTVVDKDRYGRLAGKVKQGETDVNLAMVRAGFAWWFSKYAPKETSLKEAEAEARSLGGQAAYSAVGVPAEEVARASSAFDTTTAIPPGAARRRTRPRSPASARPAPGGGTAAAAPR